MIRTVMIVEMAGGPPEYVKEMLSKHIGRLGGYRELEIQDTKISEPKLISKEKEMYTCFAEVEFKSRDLAQLMEIVFEFMPSSVEVIEPAKLTLDPLTMTEFFNNLAGRLHRYDEIAKVAHFRIRQLSKLLKEAEDAGFLEFKRSGGKVKKKKKKKSAKKSKA
ncbi:hypothetical protein D6829_00335 [Candidatus Pacearchaeota archaeon]|nr:MAG: hypothetical protein D6829_00335 [Candidatus Pacearchaeota archaeon]